MSENTKTGEHQSKTKDRIIWLLFALVIVLLYFFALDIPLLGPDEPRYAQVAREMFERGDWITPKLGGFDWFEKPALLYWLQIISYKIFGVSEFAARFGSAVFGLGTIFALWILGKVIQNSRFENQDLRETAVHSSMLTGRGSFANWLALIAASSIGLIVFSRGASFDIILTFPVTAALAAFSIAHLREKCDGLAFYFPLILFYFFVGIALIAKGLVGIIFPFAIVGFYYVLSLKLPSKAIILSLLWGTILSLIVAAIWYLPMYQTNGWKFIDEFFIQHHFQRYSSNKYQHPQPFWFFWIVLPLMTVPWIPFFFISVWKFLKSYFSNLKSRNQRLEAKLKLQYFAFAWLFVPLIFFSLSGSKLPGYILPALPGALILTAICVYEFVSKSARRALFSKSLAALTFIIIAFLLEFAVMRFAPHETVKDLISQANSKGFGNAKIVNFLTLSHNAEFYGANRLVRTEDGKQKRFDSTRELADFLKAENKTALVLVPIKDADKLSDGDLLNVETLGNNTKLAAAAVSAK